MVANLSFLDPKGVALISWTVTIMAMAGLGLMVADVKKWLWARFSWWDSPPNSSSPAYVC